MTIAVAGVLFFFLFRHAGLNLADIARVLLRLSPLHVVLIVIGITTPVWLGSEKWRIVVERITPPPYPGRKFFFYYSCLAVMLGQLVTQYISGPLVRGLALRRIWPDKFRYGAASSGFEQSFDAWVTLVFSLSGISFFLLGLPAGAALIAFVPVAWLGMWLVLALVRRDGSARGRMRLPARLATIIDSAAEAGLLRRRLLKQLYCISVLRFWALAPFVLAVAEMTHGSWQPEDILFAFAIAQFTRFAALTPGNMGVGEWGWVVVLVGFGWPFEEAALFSLSMRVLALIAMMALFSVTAIWHLLTGGTQNIYRGGT